MDSWWNCFFGWKKLNLFIKWFEENCPDENCPPTPKLILTHTLTLNRGQFSSGAIVWLAPTLKLTLTLTETPTLTRGQFPSGGNCPDTLTNISYNTLDLWAITLSTSCDLFKLMHTTSIEYQNKSLNTFHGKPKKRNNHNLSIISNPSVKLP